VLELHCEQADTTQSAAVQEAERIQRDSSSREAHLKGLLQCMGVANESMETKVVSLFTFHDGRTAEHSGIHRKLVHGGIDHDDGVLIQGIDARSYLESKKYVHGPTFHLRNMCTVLP